MFEKFKTRSLQLERLDTGDYTADEYARLQDEMQMIHRFFGEVRALKKTLLKELGSLDKAQVSILDVGAGFGGMLSELEQMAGEKRLVLAGLELDPVAARSIRERGFSAVQGDALCLPFGDDAFDFVFCTLFLHHLSDDNAVALIKEMARVAARRMFVIDLNRHPTAYYLYRYLGPMLLQPLAVEDGSLSILRSFDETELMELSVEAGLRDARVEKSPLNRLILSGR